MKNLPTSQLEIMSVIWSEDRPMTRTEIQRILEQSRDSQEPWTTSTVNTLLRRLTDSGFLKSEKAGKEYCYTAVIGKEEYRSSAGRKLLSKLYDNSVKKFIAAAYAEGALSQGDILELEEFIKELKEG